MHRRWVWLATALLSGTVACAASAHLEGRMLHKDGRRFQIGTLGPSWTRLRIGNEDLAFHDPVSGAVLTVQASCERDYEDAPLRSLTRHLWFGLTDVAVLSQASQPMAERESLWTVADARLDGVPVRMHSVVLKKDGCVHDFVLTHPRPDEAGWKRINDEFRTFVGGFEGPWRE